jgi:hypothetical protein
MGGLSWLRTGISGGILWKLHLTKKRHKKDTLVPVIKYHGIKTYGGVKVYTTYS